jgi:hypothetical protein
MPSGIHGAIMQLVSGNYNVPTNKPKYASSNYKEYPQIENNKFECNIQRLLDGISHIKLVVEVPLKNMNINAYTLLDKLDFIAENEIELVTNLPIAPANSNPDNFLSMAIPELIDNPTPNNSEDIFIMEMMSESNNTSQNIDVSNIVDVSPTVVVEQLNQVADNTPNQIKHIYTKPLLTLSGMSLFFLEKIKKKKLVIEQTNSKSRIFTYIINMEDFGLGKFFNIVSLGLFYRFKIFGVFNKDINTEAKVSVDINGVLYDTDLRKAIATKVMTTEYDFNTDMFDISSYKITNFNNELSEYKIEIDSNSKLMGLAFFIEGFHLEDIEFGMTLNGQERFEQMTIEDCNCDAQIHFGDMDFKYKNVGYIPLSLSVTDKASYALNLARIDQTMFKIRKKNDKTKIKSIYFTEIRLNQMNYSKGIYTQKYLYNSDYIWRTGFAASAGFTAFADSISKIEKSIDLMDNVSVDTIYV